MYPTIDKVKTGQRIRDLMEKRNLSVKDIKEYLSLASVQGIYLWLSGGTIPSIDNLYALSELFRVPLDDLICGNRKPVRREREVESLERLSAYYIKLHEQRAA